MLAHLIFFKFFSGASGAAAPASFGGTISPMGIFALMPRFSGVDDGGGAGERVQDRQFLKNVGRMMNI